MKGPGKYSWWNEKSIYNNTWDGTPRMVIERSTGLDFFPNFPSSIEAINAHEDLIRTSFSHFQGISNNSPHRTEDPYMWRWATDSCEIGFKAIRSRAFLHLTMFSFAVDETNFAQLRGPVPVFSMLTAGAFPHESRHSMRSARVNRASSWPS